MNKNLLFCLITLGSVISGICWDLSYFGTSIAFGVVSALTFCVAPYLIKE